MNLGGLRARKPREWVILLLLPALAFRLLVPAGFMPVVDHGVAVTMQMCHGDAQSAVVIRLAGHGGTPGEHGARHDSPCVFAATASVAPLPQLPGPVAAAAPVDPVPAPRHTAPFPRLLHHPQSPRAPPVYV